MKKSLVLIVLGFVSLTGLVYAANLTTLDSKQTTYTRKINIDMIRVMDGRCFVAWTVSMVENQNIQYSGITEFKSTAQDQFIQDGIDAAGAANNITDK